MSHEIDETNGPAIAFIGETPWHGLGTQLPEGASIDVWRTTAKLDWQVKEGQVLYTREVTGEVKSAAAISADGTPLESVQFPGRKALYRGDNGAPLSIVSDGFQVVQPGDVLEFFRKLCEEHGFKMETAGALRGGRKIWALARIAEAFRVQDDEVRPFCLFSTAYDATMATWARLCATRVVCANTIAVAENEQGKMVRVPHNAKLDFDDVRLQLGIALNAWERYKVRALKMAEREITDEEAEQFIRELLGLAEGAVPKLYVRLKKLFKGDQMGAVKKSTRQTLWGLVQAVAEHVDHNPWSRSADTRLDNAWFGYGNDMKIAAFKRALAIVEPEEVKTAA
jgi:phage/plasmid-like protein (TIGR03299 family)